MLSRGLGGRETRTGSGKQTTQKHGRSVRHCAGHRAGAGERRERHGCRARACAPTAGGVLARGAVWGCGPAVEKVVATCLPSPQHVDKPLATPARQWAARHAASRSGSVWAAHNGVASHWEIELDCGARRGSAWCFFRDDRTGWRSSARRAPCSLDWELARDVRGGEGLVPFVLDAAGELAAAWCASLFLPPRPLPVSRPARAHCPVAAGPTGRPHRARPFRAAKTGRGRRPGAPKFCPPVCAAPCLWRPRARVASGRRALPPLPCRHHALLTLSPPPRFAGGSHLNGRHRPAPPACAAGAAAPQA